MFAYPKSYLVIHCSSPWLDTHFFQSFSSTFQSTNHEFNPFTFSLLFTPHSRTRSTSINWPERIRCHILNNFLCRQYPKTWTVLRINIDFIVFVKRTSFCDLSLLKVCEIVHRWITTKMDLKDWNSRMFHQRRHTINVLSTGLSRYQIQSLLSWFKITPIVARSMTNLIL